MCTKWKFEAKTRKSFSQKLIKLLIKILDNNTLADFYSVCNTNKCLIKLYDHNSNDKIIIARNK